MNTSEITISSLKYVLESPYFWPSMGMTTSVSMFIGAMIYNGKRESLYVGIITMMTYGFFLFSTTLLRINGHGYSLIKNQYQMAYASSATLLLITFFYVVGLLFGYAIKHRIRKGDVHES
jgi:hypothetical protein